MRPSIIIFLFFLLLSSSIIGQQQAFEYGTLSDEEIQMGFYAEDANEEAVILFDVGISRFVKNLDGAYDIRFTRHKRIKIFNKSAIEHTEVSIPYYVDGYGKTERVNKIKASTYHIENGRAFIKDLDPEMIYDEKINELWRNKKFIFPDVRDGSIIEFSYELTTPFHFNLPDWTFQNTIPTIYSEYEVRMIPFYEYSYLVQGATEFDIQKSDVDKKDRVYGTIVDAMGTKVGKGVKFRDVIHTFILKDVPAFKDESFISSINDYIIKMDFQLLRIHYPQGGTSEIISTWPKLIKSLLKNEHFGKYIKKSKRLAKNILSKNPNLIGKTDEETIKAITEFVKRSFTWNGKNSKYAIQNPASFFKNKMGNSAEINLFLIALLNNADIKCVPVVLSTRKNGKIKYDYPFDHFTNYVIGMVYDEQKYLVDGTEPSLPFHQIPYRCINEKGLIVEKTEIEDWVYLQSEKVSEKNHSIFFTIDRDKELSEFEASIQSTHFTACDYKQKFQDDNEMIQDHFTSIQPGISMVKTSGFDNPGNTYSINLAGTTDLLMLSENVIIINPFLGLAIDENPFKQTKRNYPVDFIYKSKESFNIKMNIPEGYSLSEIPEAYSRDNELVKIDIKYDVIGDNLSITGAYQFKKEVYTAKEYSRVKFYMDKIVELFNAEILFEK